MRPNVFAFALLLAIVATPPGGFASPVGLPYEPSGPSSRRSGLAITEIMYHPEDRTDGRRTEFIELYNSNPFQEDLSGYRLTGDWEYTFPNGTIIPGSGYLVVARAPEDVQAVYGLSGVLGGFATGLPNDTGTIRLSKRSGGVVLEIIYSDQPPWPAAADGPGHSIVLARPSYGEGSSQAWVASAWIGGSPGMADPLPSGALEQVVINEFLAHTDEPEADYLELYNHSTEPVDLSGCVLTDDPATNKFVIPDGTTIPARGFHAFTQTTLNFSLNAAGETIYLKNPPRTRVIDAVRFEAQENGIASGRSPDGGAEFYRLSSPTPGTNNATILIGDVVINELMYHPISGNDDDQFVELYNRGSNVVSLSGWRLSDAVSLTFPSNTVLTAGGYLVVAKNAARLRTRYSTLNASNTLGNWSGNLAHRGERITLRMPDTVMNVNSEGQLETNLIHIVVYEVTYGTAGRWGRWSEGGGSSLELIDARSNPRLAANWADSDESAKSEWTLVESTGVLNLGHPSVPTADQLQVFLLGAGEALMDQVEAFVPGSPNRLPNPDFESGPGGWYSQGTHRLTAWETGAGYASARSLHLRATDDGNQMADRVRAPFTAAFTPGQTVTIRAKVRWLRGWPEVLFRLKGGYLEAFSPLTIPPDLGTPGAVNSQAQANVGPAIYNVSHYPVLPAINQPIRVTATVEDSDGVQSMELEYRIDPAATLVNVTMRDDGFGGDQVARDGIYTGVIPGQLAGTLVAFRIEATDYFAPPATTRFPATAPTRECLVRVGETVPTNVFGTYRFWITQATFDFWSSREKMSGENLDATFVYGTNRVIYNAGARFGGSPYSSAGYTTPTGNLCRYDLDLPADDSLLGETRITLDWPARDPANQREQLMYWFLEQFGLPNNYRRYINMYVNGVRRGIIYDDVQKPGGRPLKQWFPHDSDGALYKANVWDEFNDAGNRIGSAILLNSLEPYVNSDGAKKAARYRWNWQPRARNGTANDFADLFALVDTLNAPVSGYASAAADLVDVEHWMKTFCMNDLASYWDAFGNPNAKNTYLYKPENDRWKLMSYDLDIGLGVKNDPIDAPLFPILNDPAMNRLYATSEFVRPYWRALHEALNTFYQTGPGSAINAILDEKYAVFQTNDLALTAPSEIKIWLNQRRAFLQSQLAAVNAPFAITSPTLVTTNRNLITIQGSAPVNVKTITINGVAYPITWNSVTSWTLTLPLGSGINVLNIQGLDSWDQPLAGTTATVTADFTGPAEAPENAIVINEIMFAPLVPEAEYVELFNTSTNHAFSLAGWKFDGLSYTFPDGAFISPREYLVLAKDRAAFNLAYGLTQPVFDIFSGNLQSNGETLSLLKPESAPNQFLVVDRVRYEATPPWPVITNGASLQLRDAAQDNSRVGNWAIGSVANPPPQMLPLITHTDVWKYMQLVSFDGVNWTAPAFNDIAWPAGGGLLAFENNPAIVPLINTALNDPRLAINNASPGHAYYFRATMNIPHELSGYTVNAGAYIDDGAVFYVNGVEAARLRMAGGLVTNLSFAMDSPASGDALNPDPFSIPTSLFVPGTNVVAVEVHQAAANSSDITFGLKLDAVFTGLTYPLKLATPGASNSVTAALPFFPPVWLNEAQTDNLTGPLDNFGEPEPWVELYNSGPNALDLSDYFLSDNFTNLAQWRFPPGAAIPAGGFLMVWGDNQTNQNTALTPHTNFRLDSGSGRVALSRLVSGTNQIVDYLAYTNLPFNWSYGAVPDGQTFYRDNHFYFTPGATNNGTSPPLTIFVNEWMADNTHTLADPADGGFEDWFELYNPGPNPVDVGGYYLTDNLTNKTKFLIPANGHYRVPPQGFLLVWADDEPAQNSTNRADLHVGFALSEGGEAIGLFAPDGTQIDAVIFGAQASDVSEGRYRDGTAIVFTMPTATPRTKNIIPNTAPILGAISDRFVHQGQTVTFTATATDAESADQVLTFSLDAGAPAAANITAASGSFAWATAFGPSTNAMTVRVTDDGLPTMSDAKTFIVFVGPPLQISGRPVVLNGIVTFSIQSLPGQEYQLEYTDNLGEVNWLPLGSLRAGTGADLVFSDLVGSHAQRFYRIKLP